MLLGPGTFGGFMLVPRRNNWTSCVYMRVSFLMRNPVTCIDTYLLLGGHDSQILVRHPEVLLELRKAERRIRLSSAVSTSGDSTLDIVWCIIDGLCHIAGDPGLLRDRPIDWNADRDIR